MKLVNIQIYQACSFSLSTSHTNNINILLMVNGHQEINADQSYCRIHLLTTTSV